MKLNLSDTNSGVSGLQLESLGKLPLSRRTGGILSKPRLTITRRPLISPPKPRSTAVKTPVASPLSLPTLSVSSITYNSARLSWNYVSGQSVSYQVATSLSFSSILKSGTSTGSAVTVTGLSPATTYYVRVRRNEGSRYTAWILGKTFKTQIPPGGGGPNRGRGPSVKPAPTSTPSVPSLSVSSVTYSSVRLSWNDVSGQSVTYQVSEAGNFTRGLKSATSTGSAVTVTGLKPNQTYYVRARRNASGKSSAWSGIKKFRTSTPIPTPSVPSLSVSSVTYSGARLDWNAVPGQSVTYQISEAGNFTRGLKSATSSGSAIMVRDLKPNQTYYVRVRRNASGKSSGWSGVKTFKTQIPPGGGGPNPGRGPVVKSLVTPTLTKSAAQIVSSGGKSVKPSVYTSFVRDSGTTQIIKPVVTTPETEIKTTPMIDPNKPCHECEQKASGSGGGGAATEQTTPAPDEKVLTLNPDDYKGPSDGASTETVVTYFGLGTGLLGFVTEIIKAKNRR